MFLRGYTVPAALPVALIVGTILAAVNQGPVIINGHANCGTWLRIAFNYAVPFVVASVGYLSAQHLARKYVDRGVDVQPEPSTMPPGEVGDARRPAVRHHNAGRNRGTFAADKTRSRLSAP